MKKLTLLLSLFFFFATSNSAEAQIWKKIQKKAERKIEKKAEEKIDEILEKKEEKKDTPTPKKDEDEDVVKEDKDIGVPNEEKIKTANSKQTPEIWRNYKFIPGEKIIFYDDLKFEEVGEFPSRWDLITGGAEIAKFDDEKVIITTAKYNNRIIPLFENNNYLSDEFTIEFDVYVEESNASNYWTEIDLTLSAEIMKTTSSHIRIMLNDGKTTGGHVMSSAFPVEKVSLGELNTWHHVALSFYKGKLKVYYDEKRIANLPKAKLVPGQFGLSFRGYASGKNGSLNTAVKNIRIAHGGGQMYKRIVTDGKYVTNGILFDSGKSSIKAQSFGIINKVVTVMNENPDWKFQIIGHTDSDGTNESNLTLSKQRAEAVKQAIVNLGITVDRLSTLGKGESEPISTNTSPEEKANNRRVEFIKQ